jgi:uncharacterized membrane protein YhhN
MRTFLIGLLFVLEGIFLILDCRQKYHHQKRWFKGLLMPVVIVLYTFLFHTFQPLQMLGMIGGWLGDLFLLREEKPYFLAGCLSFMAGHIFYGVLYLHEIRLAVFPLWSLLAVPVYVCYALGVYHHLKPHIPSDFRIYAFLYMFFITLMSFTALCRIRSVPMLSWSLTWIGSLVFMASDTLVAYEKFVNPEVRGIIETYVPAQVLLMLGAAVH